MRSTTLGARAPTSSLAGETPISLARGIRRRAARRSVGIMDTSSMIMGASIASVAWIALYPWAKLRRLRESEAQSASDTPDA